MLFRSNVQVTSAGAVGARATVSSVASATWTLTGASAAILTTIFVAEAAAVSATAITPSPASPIYGDTLSLGINVYPTSASGTVTVAEGATTVGSCTLASGACTVSAGVPTAGAHTYTATFGGDGVSGSSAASLTVTVAQVATTATLLTSNASTIYGNPVTLSVEIGRAHV